MIHAVRPLEAEPGTGDLVIETLIRFRREGYKISLIRVKTHGYLWMAFLLQINDPDAEPRLVPHRSYGKTDPFTVGMRPVTISVRVGSSFAIEGPSGPCTIEEDTSP